MKAKRAKLPNRYPLDMWGQCNRERTKAERRELERRRKEHQCSDRIPEVNRAK
jgi:hypothetical protein